MWQLSWFSTGHRINTTIGIDLAVDHGYAAGRSEISSH
jgi:hypothetical protein